MTPSLFAGLVVVIALAFVLSAAESALPRISRGAAQDLVEEGRRGSRALATILDDPAGYLGVTAFVRVVSETTAAVLVTLGALELFHEPWEALLVSIAVMAVASFVLVVVSPRTLGRRHVVGIALAAAPFVVWLRRLLGPVARLLVVVGNALTPGKGYRDGPFASEAELRDLVDLAGERAVIEAQEREMIHSVFEFGDTLVGEVMVPRTDMVTIDADRRLRQGMSLFLRSGFSRVPVIGDDADDPVGLLYLKDVAKRLENDPEAAGELVETLMRPVPFVPESKPVDALMREMQRDQIHMAVVVDEYGGTAGLVTIEDLIEELVGEISDEHDRDTPGVEELDDGSVRIPASMDVDDFADHFGLDLDDENDVESVGGLIAKELGRVPILGSSVRVGPLVLTADRMAGRRHRLASVVVVPDEAEEPSGEDRDPAAEAGDEAAHGGGATALEPPRRRWRRHHDERDEHDDPEEDR